jgi:thymidylate synthase ThyX
MFKAKIITDSISERNNRLTTFEITFPRIILAEFNTHRVFSRNSASSRAIPVEKMIKMVEENPYIPEKWGRNQKGMQSYEFLTDTAEITNAKDAWLRARDNAIRSANELLGIGIHKQITNRLLEPFMWHTVIVTATEWSNYFHLRNHKEAHPDICRIASMMQEVYETSVPVLLKNKEWHIPFITEDDISDAKCAGFRKNIDIDWERLIKISTGRCARVSYLTHDGRRDYYEDIKLHDRLLTSGHMSPFEHQAYPVDHDGFIGNFKGWRQYRKTISGEFDMLGRSGNS